MRIGFALFNLWVYVVSEVVLLAALVCAIVFVAAMFAMLGLPFWRLSEALTPRVLDALRKGQERRRRRLEATQRALRRVGELVVGFTSLGVLAAVVIALWGVEVLVIGGAAVVVLGLLARVAERLGLVDPTSF